MTALFENVDGSALFSECRRYRYWLSRKWNDGDRLINFVMLNPSTADETVNDPTIERCQRRAKSLGFDGLYVTNIFALRSTDPSELYKQLDPMGPENDAWLGRIAEQSEIVVAAWGTHGAYRGRGEQVTRWLNPFRDRLRRLGSLTKDGHPRHPLYVSYKVGLQAFG